MSVERISREIIERLYSVLFQYIASTCYILKYCTFLCREDTFYSRQTERLTSYFVDKNIIEYRSYSLIDHHRFLERTKQICVLLSVCFIIRDVFRIAIHFTLSVKPSMRFGTMVVNDIMYRCKHL